MKLSLWRNGESRSYNSAEDDVWMFGELQHDALVNFSSRLIGLRQHRGCALEADF